MPTKKVRSAVWSHPHKPLDTGRMALAFFVLLAGLALASCNTVRGVGEDIEAAGGAISESAEEIAR